MLNIVKNTTIINPLELLAPHSCQGCNRIGSALCDRCKKYILNSQQNLCPHCKSPKTTGACPHCPDLPPAFIGGERTGLLASLIHDYKYHSIRALAKPLADIMTHALPDFHQPVCIIPLPTITRHIRARGFDHTLLIAKHLSRLTGHPVNHLLTRTKNTVQVGTDRTTRQQQANTAYALTTKRLDPTLTYILFDDVWTTGASMQSCAKLLRSAGAVNLVFAILSLSRID